MAVSVSVGRRYVSDGLDDGQICLVVKNKWQNVRLCKMSQGTLECSLDMRTNTWELEKGPSRDVE